MKVFKNECRFVWQIPKDMDEDSLRPYFVEYGPIFELTVIRDKATKVHRGFCFKFTCEYFIFLIILTS